MNSERLLAGVVFLAIPTALWLTLYFHHPGQAMGALVFLGVLAAAALVFVVWLTALLTLFRGRPSDQ